MTDENPALVLGAIALAGQPPMTFDQALRFLKGVYENAKMCDQIVTINPKEKG